MVGQSRFEVGGVCELDDDAVGRIYYYTGLVETLEMTNGWGVFMRHDGGEFLFCFVLFLVYA